MSVKSSISSAPAHVAPAPGAETSLPPTGSDLVSGEFPPLPGVPCITPRPVHWLAAPFVAPLGLLLPARLGPHLAASGWRSPFFVYVSVCILLLGIGVCFISGAYATVPEFLDSVESFRHPADVLAGSVYAFQRALDTGIAIIVLVYGLGFTLAVLFFAWLLQPWVTVGEGRWRTWARAVRLLLWCSVALLAIPYIVAFATSEIFAGRDTEGFGVGVAITALVQYMVVAAVIQAQRYAGPQVGRGWQVRELTCEGCSQNLAFAPLAGACPECGRPITESLPARRELPPTARPLAYFLWPWHFVRTWWASLDATRFGGCLRVWSGRPGAIAFLFTVIGICAAMASTTILLAMLGERSQFDVGRAVRFMESKLSVDGIGFIAVRFLFFASVSFALISTWTLIVGLASTGFGWNATYRHGVVLSYASGILIPLAVLGCTLGLVLYWFSEPAFGAPYLFTLAGYRIDAVTIAASVGLALAAAGAVLGGLHVRKMLLATRYANA